MANREVKRKNIAYDVEEPPKYKDLYPMNVLIPASPPPYTASSSHSITSDQAAVSTETNNRVTVITQPESSRSQQPASYYQNQSQILAYSKERDIFGIFLIVLSSISMVLTLPIGIHAFIWSCAAYHADDKSEKNRYRSISIIVNMFSCLAMLTLVIAIPIAVIRAAAQD